MLPAVRRNLPSPWDEPFDTLRRDFARWLTGWPQDQAIETSLTGAYPTDITEDDENVYVNAELPGFTKNEIEVSLDDGVLSIAAERRPEDIKGRTHLRERTYTKVQRRFTLPSAVDDSHVQATFENGVLHLKMKKSESKKPHRIQLS
jgi:HSP20 family protein